MEEQHKNRYVLYHAQSSDLYIPAKIYLELMKIISGHSICTWPLRFCNFKGSHMDPFHEEENQQRTQGELLKLVMTDESVSERGSHGVPLLFMNFSPLTGSASSLYEGSGGSSTLWFLLNSHSEYVGKGECPDILSIFTTLQLNNLYKKWEKELVALIQKAPKREFGTLLTCSFSPQTLKNTVYLARANGRKEEYDALIGKEKRANDIISLLDALAHNPHDIPGLWIQFEFCAALTGGQHGLLNLWNEGIRVTPYTVEDMSAWNKECEKLFARIAQDCKDDNEIQKIFEGHRKDIMDQKLIDPTTITSRL
jgi:hypothetical protein